MQEDHRIDFHTTSYFPQPMRAMAVLSLLTVFIPAIHPAAKALVAVAALAVLTAHYRLRFEPGKKEYFDYVWLLGLKWGEYGRLDKIDYLFIKRNKVKQTMYSLMSVATFHSEQYDGYLRISETNKIHLLSSRRKETVMKRLQALSLLLGADILDYTTE